METRHSYANKQHRYLKVDGEGETCEPHDSTMFESLVDGIPAVRTSRRERP